MARKSEAPHEGGASRNSCGGSFRESLTSPALNEQALGAENALVCTEPELASTSSDGESGASLLDDARAFYCRFVAFPTHHAAVAVALWAAHCHAMDAWDCTPRLAFLSPEFGSGKTRGLEITGLLVPRPVLAMNVTPAYLFRKVADPNGRPTILHDEIDTVFGPKVRRDVEETRGLLNAGHHKGALTGRCKVVGKTVQTEEIEAYCAVALAGLGNLPDTITSRAIVIRMRRRAPHERVEPYRRRKYAHEGAHLRDRLAEWIGANEAELTSAEPEMPPGVEDRAEDVWAPLIAIADAAGGEWPRLAREAAVAFVTEAREIPASLGVRLLGDIRVAFGGTKQMPTTSLLKALNSMDEAPWADLRGKPLDSRKLAELLKPYGLKSKTIRFGSETSKGYRRDDLWDPWQRYLSPSSPEGVTSVTSETGAVTIPSSDANTDGHSVTDVTDFEDGRQTDPGRWIGESPAQSQARLVNRAQDQSDSDPR